MKAIETHYAGCRFRSRLEARWAVVLDTLNIEWQYEPEGFDCAPRLSNGCVVEGHRYLPDFWLPQHKIWVEVKGHLTDKDLFKTLDCLADLSSNSGAGRHDSGGHDSVVLGPIPRPHSGIAPVSLCMNKGVLMANPWTGQEGPCLLGRQDFSLAGDYGGDLNDICDGRPDYVRQILIEGLPATLTPQWERALTAGRKAQFEHGAKG